MYSSRIEPVCWGCLCVSWLRFASSFPQIGDQPKWCAPPADRCTPKKLRVSSGSDLEPTAKVCTPTTTLTRITIGCFGRCVFTSVCRRWLLISLFKVFRGRVFAYGFSEQRCKKNAKQLYAKGQGQLNITAVRLNRCFCVLRFFYRIAICMHQICKRMLFLRVRFHFR